jgi:putative FmdB family regulatory protein
MPIYEFFCPECSTIFSFLSRSVDTQKRPSCPRCKKNILERKVSLFAAIGKKGEKPDSGGDDPSANMPVDESRMEKAMEALSGEVENINEDDPRQAAKLMRKFSDLAGLRYNDKIEEALTRMESGEDPEQVEAEMGDALENMEDPFAPGEKKGAGQRRARITRDETLYEM